MQTGTSTKRDYKKYVDAFGQRMLAKLQKNEHKGEWEGLPLRQAFILLEQEVFELRAEVMQLELGHPDDADIVNNLLDEAADVANFALIIASVALRAAGKDLPGTENDHTV